MSIEVRRAGDRFRTLAEGRSTWHSFSFGSHYDPANLGFAAMIAHNDEELPGGTGYPDHRHAETEIVTWVLEGALRHTDAAGNAGVLGAGAVQRISAGTGIVHAETSEPGVRTRFLQTWLRPDVPGAVPSYARARGVPGTGIAEVTDLGVGVAGARLLVGRISEHAFALPDAPRLHVFVADGSVTLGTTELGPGDAVRLGDRGGEVLHSAGGASMAVWAFGT
jgi:redox-sensitive bicupin YhaK (pirin superfamily)